MYNNVVKEIIMMTVSGLIVAFVMNRVAEKKKEQVVDNSSGWW